MISGSSNKEISKIADTKNRHLRVDVIGQNLNATIRQSFLCGKAKNKSVKQLIYFLCNNGSNII